jgi:hypothetical protein
MPSPKGLTPDELELQAQTLQRLIDDAQALQNEITAHLKKLRRENRLNAQPISERRQKPR